MDPEAEHSSQYQSTYGLIMRKKTVFWNSPISENYIIVSIPSQFSHYRLRKQCHKGYDTQFLFGASVVSFIPFQGHSDGPLTDCLFSKCSKLWPCWKRIFMTGPQTCGCCSVSKAMWLQFRHLAIHMYLQQWQHPVVIWSLQTSFRQAKTSKDKQEVTSCSHVTLFLTTTGDLFHNWSQKWFLSLE